LDDVALNGYAPVFFNTLPIVLLVHIAIFSYLGMYREVWRHANINSALVVIRSLGLATTFLIVLNIFISQQQRVPRSIPIIYLFLAVFAVIAVRFSWRLWSSLKLFGGPSKVKERCFIYGAGSAGELLARHITADVSFPYSVVGFIDDDKNKRGRMLHGLKIYGSGLELAGLVTKHRVGTVILAVHSMSGKPMRELVARCQAAGIKPLIMPDLAASLSSEPFKPRTVDVKDLLCRTPKSIDVQQVKKFFFGRSVLITGAGGSIGSELSRQIIHLKPQKLILFDSSEYNLYRIEQELSDLKLEGVIIVPILGSATESRVVEKVFLDHKPTCVVHAAAYKHVSLVEQNPLQGIINNVLGTQVVAEAAIAHGVSDFLLISTDKAVRPTSVMGATKRCCELIIQALYLRQGGSCRFSSVRFGNVLGSSGSVIPRFAEQIQGGNQVTVTHPEVTRYFMLIPEAVALCLQSLAMAKGGEIFVLNMGEPVKIYDMAKQLILLAGKELGRDVEIIFTGLKPGEKLYEELILEGAEQQTQHEDVFVAIPHPIDDLDIMAKIVELVKAATKGDLDACMYLLRILTNFKLTRNELANTARSEGPSDNLAVTNTGRVPVLSF
jgi:FlaA1/EpsC-like NDP-sugar epimerase